MFWFSNRSKPLAGKLLIDKAIAAGVPKGPMLQQLKSGNDVRLEDGTVVSSESVIGEPKPGFVVTILGDTSVCEASIELSQGADIVVHEATFNEETGQLAKDFGHSTIQQAAEVVRVAGAKALVATHISSRFLPSDIDAFQKEGQEIFPNVFVANDFAQYSLEHGQVVESVFKK